MGITFTSPKIETSFGKTVRATRVSADIPGVVDNGIHLAIHDEKTGFNIPCSKSDWMVFSADQQLIAVLSAHNFEINYGEPLENHKFKLVFTPTGHYRTTAFIRGDVENLGSELLRRVELSFTTVSAWCEELDIVTSKPCSYRNFIAEVKAVIKAAIAHHDLVDHVTNLLTVRDQPESGESISLQLKSISPDHVTITMLYFLN